MLSLTYRIRYMEETDKTIKAGKLLLAEPFMLDSHFKRATLILCEHNEEGSIGFILNRPLEVSVSGLIQDFPDFDAEVFYGGPVENDTIHYIHNVGDLLEDSVKVAPGVYWGGDFEKLKFLIRSELVKPENIRFFVGYSGWSTGQLAEETRMGSWVSAELSPNYIFKFAPEELWQEVMYRKGGKYTVLAQISEGVSWN